MTTAFKPLTKDDIAEVLGVSLRTIENWVNDGTVPAPKRLGNRVYWHPTVFYGWLEQRLTTDEAASHGEGAVALSPPAAQAVKPVRGIRMAKTESDRLRSSERAKSEALLA